MIQNLHILTDEHLVKMAQEGSETAEEILIEKYKGYVKLKAQSYFIVGAEPEDVVQEGMIGLFKAIRAYDSDKEAGFRTFANRCINNQILTAIRKADREKQQPLNESVSLNREVESEGRSISLGDILKGSMDEEPEAKLILGENLKIIKSQNDEIFSPMERKVWNLKLRGMDYREIAQVLDKTPKSIDNTLQRIRKKILKILEK